jgi:type III secretion protein L
MSEGSIANATPLPRSPGVKIIRRDEAQSWIDGYHFLEEARRSAAALLLAAQSGCEKARARGLDEGRNAGAAEAAAMVADTRGKCDRYLASIESQVAELSLSIIEQVLGTLDEAEVVARVTKRALASFRRDKHVTIRVAPELLEAVQLELSTWTAAEPVGPTLTVEADARCAPRQCAIVTEFAVVDASVDAQLNVFRRILATSGARGS